MSKGGRNVDTNQSIIIEQISSSLTHAKFREFDTNNSQLLNVNEFTNLCCAQPELVQLILGVDILDRTELQQRKTSAKTKERKNGGGEKDDDAIENANRLGTSLNDIDHLSVQHLMDTCQKNGIELVTGESNDDLRKRLKEAVVLKQPPRLSTVGIESISGLGV